MDEFIIYHKILVVIIDTIAIWLALVVFLSNRKKLTGKLYMGMTLAMIIWVNFAYMGRIVESPDLALSLLKIAWLGTLPFTLFIYLFTISLVNKWKQYRLLTIFSISIVTLMDIFILGTDLVVKGIRYVKGDGFIGIDYGVGMLPFLAFVMFFILTTSFILLREHKTLDDDRKKSIKPFILGLILFYILNIIFNVSLPVLFDITRYYFFGDYSTLILTSLIAYAILRHRFLDIKLALSAFLISVIGMFLIVDIFILSESLVEQLLKFVGFIFYILIAGLLIRTILNEMKQKEELEKVNRALDKSRQRYFDLASEQKDIIDVMGHEIRTPLTAIVQAVKIHQKYTFPIEQKLIEESKSFPELLKTMPIFFDSMKTIERASTHATTIVTDMLETARLDKNRFELNYENFNLVDVVRLGVNLMSKTIETDTQEMKYEINFKKPESEQMIVEADKARISQAIYALLNNAIKYHDPKKSIAKVDVSLTQNESSAIIKIVDNGIGIAQEDISKLGKKFLRLDPKTDGNLKRPGGTGLGLFVVKGIMQFHKGDLIIESEGIGKGSTFTLKFPIKKA